MKQGIMSSPASLDFTCTFHKASYTDVTILEAIKAKLSFPHHLWTFVEVLVFETTAFRQGMISVARWTPHGWSKFIRRQTLPDTRLSFSCIECA